MNSGYYIMEGEEQLGPFTFDELTELEIDIHSRILSPNADTWQDACDLPELYAYFEALGVYLPTGDNLASFGWRLLAFIIDYFLICFVLGAILAVVAPGLVTAQVQSLNEMIKASRTMPYTTVLKMQIGLYTAIIVNDVIGTLSPMKGSVGKRICRLVVVDVDGIGLSIGGVLLRSAVKIISFSFYGLGFTTIFFTEHKQAVHDLLVKSYVVKRS